MLLAIVAISVLLLFVHPILAAALLILFGHPILAALCVVWWVLNILVAVWDAKLKAEAPAAAEFEMQRLIDKNRPKGHWEGDPSKGLDARGCYKANKWVPDPPKPPKLAFIFHWGEALDKATDTLVDSNAFTRWMFNRPRK
jgi:hypothetical protein